MTSSLELLDTVALLADLPTLGLRAGEVGTVVEILGDGEAYEVEFADNSGITYGLHALKLDQIIALHTRGQALRLHVEAA